MCKASEDRQATSAQDSMSVTVSDKWQDRQGEKWLCLYTPRGFVCTDFSFNTAKLVAPIVALTPPTGPDSEKSSALVDWISLYTDTTFQAGILQEVCVNRIDMQAPMSERCGHLADSHRCWRNIYRCRKLPAEILLLRQVFGSFVEVSETLSHRPAGRQNLCWLCSSGRWLLYKGSVLSQFSGLLSDIANACWNWVREDHSLCCLTSFSARQSRLIWKFDSRFEYLRQPT